MPPVSPDTHINTDETDEEAQDTGPAFDDDLDSEVVDFTIEEDDHVFMTMVHLVEILTILSVPLAQCPDA
jgi:hypothetical protein